MSNPVISSAARVHSIDPLLMLVSFWRHRELILTLVRREVIGRYRGSVLGILWSFFNPLFMLAVYTFVFTVVFQARWSGGGGTKAEFAMLLFVGLILFNLFAECVNRAPSLILGHANYVKKVVFPLEILVPVTLGSAVFHALVSLAVWLVAYLLLFGLPHATLLLLPIVLVPLLLLTLGLSWLLASLGVFLRDVSQVVVILTTTLMFLSPIFYPVSAIPEGYRGFLALNPLAPAIEQARDILFWGRGIDWGSYGMGLIASALIAWLGFAWFQRTRRGFADVL
ncbi:ABC transporter permease [Imhoffiella purpurea]|uniref:Transport permease protein n=1 Tax=Imhoffiella purpurea TaxID=1249627 RepID=W9V967_9GAMM|nr:ABC transporter permease [Imhoffiella purpurea]EXJ15984.1 O-antigen export system permease protein RfbD [Imhoffiella purpurea]